MESLSYKNFYLDVKGKDIYFIWVWLKSRKAELKQLKQISQNMLACLVVRLQLQLKIYLHKHKTTFFFRIPKNQNNFETLHCGV